MMFILGLITVSLVLLIVLVGVGLALFFAVGYAVPVIVRFLMKVF